MPTHKQQQLLGSGVWTPSYPLLPPRAPPLLPPPAPISFISFLSLLLCISSVRLAFMQLQFNRIITPFLAGITDNAVSSWSQPYPNLELPHNSYHNNSDFPVYTCKQTMICSWLKSVIRLCWTALMDVITTNGVDQILSYSFTQLNHNSLQWPVMKAPVPLFDQWPESLVHCLKTRSGCTRQQMGAVIISKAALTDGTGWKPNVIIKSPAHASGRC